MKQTIKKVLMESLLDNEFRMFVFEKTYKAPEDEKKRWRIYNTILEELRWLGDEQSVDEIKYRITDGEDPKQVFKETIEYPKYFSYKLQKLAEEI
jgi:predicted nucleic acid-binding protein